MSPLPVDTLSITSYRVITSSVVRLFVVQTAPQCYHEEDVTGGMAEDEVVAALLRHTTRRRGRHEDE